MLIGHLPHDSATARSVHGEPVGWSLTDWLLADVVDATRLAVWIQTKDGAKGRNRPPPVPRPGVTASHDEFLEAAKAQHDRLRR